MTLTVTSSKQKHTASSLKGVINGISILFDDKWNQDPTLHDEQGILDTDTKEGKLIITFYIVSNSLGTDDSLMYDFFISRLLFFII